MNFTGERKSVDGRESGRASRRSAPGGIVRRPALRGCAPVARHRGRQKSRAAGGGWLAACRKLGVPPDDLPLPTLAIRKTATKMRPSGDSALPASLVAFK